MSTPDKTADKSIIPYGPRLLVGEIGSVETVRDSGIIVPDSVAERKSLVRGLVLAVGTDVDGIEIDDTIYYRTGYQWDVRGKIVVETRDVIAVEKSD